MAEDSDRKYTAKEVATFFVKSKVPAIKRLLGKRATSGSALPSYLMLVALQHPRLARWMRVSNIKVEDLARLIRNEK